MTEQDIIREGIAQWLYCQYRERRVGENWTFDWEKVSEEIKDKFREHAKNLAHYLHSQGVVIKVGGISDDLAETASQSPTYYAHGVGISWERSNYIFKAFKDAGYVAVEPLIEEAKND